MFTGIITNIGTISSIKTISGASILKIKSSEIAHQLKPGDSIAINGVCLTVNIKEDDQFEVEAVEETLKKTTLKYFKHDEEVNLELPVSVTQRFDGHIVQGHIDCVGEIKFLKKLAKSWKVRIQIPSKYKINIVKVGSIAIDGISLTIADIIDENYFDVSIIPFTMEHTILKNKKVGSKVNIEFDIIGKYVTNYLAKIISNSESRITLEKLKKLGY